MARGGHSHSHVSRGSGSSFPGTRGHQEPTLPPSRGRQSPPIVGASGPKPPPPTDPNHPQSGTVVTPPPRPPNPGDAFLNWLKTNPDYERFHPIFEQQRGDLYANYGIVPGSQDGSGNWTIDYKTNPFSIFNALLHGTAANSTNLLNQANQAGALYSGASQASQLHEQREYAGRIAHEMTNFKNAFGQIGSTEEGDISNLYPAYTATAGPGAGATPPGPHPQSGTPVNPNAPPPVHPQTAPPAPTTATTTLRGTLPAGTRFRPPRIRR